jgi:hypothetical protein
MLACLLRATQGRERRGALPLVSGAPELVAALATPFADRYRLLSWRRRAARGLRRVLVPRPKDFTCTQTLSDRNGAPALDRPVTNVADEETRSSENMDAKGDIARDAVPIEERLRAREVLPPASARSAYGPPFAVADDEVAVDSDASSRHLHSFSGNLLDQRHVRPRPRRVM